MQEEEEDGEVKLLFLLHYTLLLHRIHIVCVEYTPSKLSVKVFDKLLLCTQLVVLPQHFAFVVEVFHILTS